MLLLKEEQTAAWPFVAYYLATAWIVLTALSRRGLFSLSVILSLGVAVWQVSRLKVKLLASPFYITDLYYFVRISTFEMLDSYKNELIEPFFCMLVVLLILVVLFKMDWPIRLRGRKDLLIPLVGIALLAVDAWLLPQGQPVGAPIAKITAWQILSSKGSPLTTFLASVSKMKIHIPSGGNGKVLERWQATPGAQQATPKNKPDIVAVLEESTFPPTTVEECSRPECQARLFVPDTSTVSSGNLLVHSLGGATWLAEFAFFTGFSHTVFGDGAVYAPYNLAPRVRHTFAGHLKTLGYKVIAVYPVQKNFINAYGAYKAYGFDEFFDASDLGLGWGSSDHKVFEGAQKIYQKEKESDPTRPLFIFILTLRQHDPHETPLKELSPPYRVTLFPGISPELNLNLSNYLDRLHDSERSMDFLESFLCSTKRPTVLVHFGDHQPAFLGVREQLHFKKEIPLQHAQQVTYYMIKRFGPGVLKKLPSKMKYPLLDVAFLGCQVLEAADLPLDDFYRANVRYRDLCQGIFECESKTLQDSYLHYVLGELKVIQ